MTSAASGEQGAGESPLGLVAGGGALPQLVAAACRAKGRPVQVIVLEDQGDPSNFAGVPCRTVRIGAAAQGVHIFRAAGVRDVTVCGYVERPGFWAMKPDLSTGFAALRIGLLGLGDGAMLKGLGRYIESQGFRLVGVDAVLSDMITPPGFSTCDVPAVIRHDLKRAFEAAKEAGARDAGQGAVAIQGRIVATEDAEGTDAMLARCAEDGRAAGGVLVKAVKPDQDRRIDLPVIGPKTVHNAAAAGLAGIGIEAEASLMLTPETVAEAARECGVFVTALVDGQVT